MMFGKKTYKRISGKKRLALTAGLAVLAQVVAGVILFFLPILKKRAAKFKKQEGEEVADLITGRQGFGNFCVQSLKLTKDFFIPSDSNDHRPKSLRPKSLLIYLVIALLIKTVATGTLFLIYPSPAEMTAVIASKMIELTNASRAEVGLPPLNINASLTKYATIKGQDMIDRGYFSHDTPEGLRPWQWIEKSEYDYVYAGENLAIDFTSAEAIQNAFMKSPSHKKNILNSRYQDIGVAVISGQMAGRQTDLLVVFFGTERTALASAYIQVPNPKSEILNSKQIQNSNVQNSKSVGLREGESVSTGEKIQPATMPTESVSGDALNQTSQGIIVISAETAPAKSLVDFIIEYSNIAFIAFIIFIATALLLNIFIKIKVQHAPLILQSLVVIALISAMVLVKFHFAEQIAPQMLILG